MFFKILRTIALLLAFFTAAASGYNSNLIGDLLIILAVFIFAIGSRLVFLSPQPLRVVVITLTVIVTLIFLLQPNFSVWMYADVSGKTMFLHFAFFVVGLIGMTVINAIWDGR